MQEPLVFVPGLTCTPALFSAQWSSLGQGRLVFAADHTQDESLEAITARLLAHAPPRFALCGLSMGGYIAFEVMRQAPERVTRLALLNTSAKGATAETNLPRQQMITLAGKGGYDSITDLFWQKFVARQRLDDLQLREQVRAMASETGADIFIRQQKAIMGRPDSRPGLSAIRVPTVMLVGEEDQPTPVEDAREIAAGIAGCRLVVLPGCGHLSTLEEPRNVTQALQEWLST